MDGKIRIGTEINTADFDKGLEHIISRMNQSDQQMVRKAQQLGFELGKALEKYKEIVDSDIYFDSDIKQASELRLQIADMVKELNKVTGDKIHINGLTDLDNNAKKAKFSFKEMGTNIKSSIASVKNLALGLIGVGGALAIIKKASSAYLTTNDKLTKQLEANWIALGTILAPVIEWIVALIKKAITWVLYFVECLGVQNAVAKANASIIKNQTKNQKQLNKAQEKYIAGFDEINKLQDDSNQNNNDNSGIDKDSLFNLSDLSDDTKRKIENIAKAVKPIYDMIKDIIDWCVKHPGALLAILGGAALLTMLAKIIGVAGVAGVGGAGLAGIYALLALIAGMGIIAVHIVITEELKNLKEDTEDTKKKTQSVTKSVKKDNKEIVKSSKNWDKLDESVRRASDAFKTKSASSLNLANYYLKKLKNNEYNGRYEMDMLTTAFNENADQIYDNIISWKKLYDQGLLNDEETNQLRQTMKAYNEMVQYATRSQTSQGAEFAIAGNRAKELKGKVDDVSQANRDLGTSADDAYNETLFLVGSVQQLDKTKGKPSIDSSNITTATNKTLTLQDKLKALNKVYKANVQINIEAVNKLKKTSYGKTYANVLEDLINFELGHAATGGIVNNPGRGVMLGNVVTGEAGREGVIPLTDPQAMSQLGYEIGRHIVVDLTNITTLNSKEIAREQKRIDGQQSFARNGRS